MIGHRMATFLNYLSIPVLMASTVGLGYLLIKNLGLSTDLLPASIAIILIFLLGLYSEGIARVINKISGSTVKTEERSPLQFSPTRRRSVVFGSGFPLRPDEAKDKLRTIKQASDEIEQQVQEITDIMDEAAHSDEQRDEGDAPARDTLS